MSKIDVWFNYLPLFIKSTNLLKPTASQLLGYDFGVENAGDFSAVDIELVKYTTNFLLREKPR